MPIGQKFTLSNGRTGKIVRFYKHPKVSEDGAYKDRWCFGFDVHFQEGSPDHLEFFVYHTGGGGFVGDPALKNIPVEEVNED